MSIIDEWINPIYLNDDCVDSIRESVFAKPVAQYAVLDNFFREEKLDELIAQHSQLSFSEEQDRRSPHDGVWLPYDGAVVFAKRDKHVGSDLFFDQEWHRYCCYLVGAELKLPVETEIKLRYHRPNADGFWIHTDSAIRAVVIITYFNRHWLHTDGGLLQLWRVDEELSATASKVDNPTGRLNCLLHQRIQTRGLGGGDGNLCDLTLLDQIVPTYNRVFICNLMANPTYHSVTPSNGKERLGFVQWLHRK